MDDKQICQWMKNEEDMKWSGLKWGWGLEEGSFSLISHEAICCSQFMHPPLTRSLYSEITHHSYPCPPLFKPMPIIPFQKAGVCPQHTAPQKTPEASLIQLYQQLPSDGSFSSAFRCLPSETALTNRSNPQFLTKIWYSNSYPIAVIVFNELKDAMSSTPCKPQSRHSKHSHCPHYYS